jgi:hypothetical protein
VTRASTGFDLRGELSVSDRKRPLLTGANGPLMARRPEGSRCRSSAQSPLVTACTVQGMARVWFGEAPALAPFLIPDTDLLACYLPGCPAPAFRGCC